MTWVYLDPAIVQGFPLDNVLASRQAQIDWKLRSFLDGKILTPDDMPAFHAQVQSNLTNKLYPTTDHLIIEARQTESPVRFLYLSLDNSVRANQAGYPLKDRLSALVDVIKEAVGFDPVIIFFSEACCPSFSGSDAKSGLSWFQMRCGLSYLGECANNEDLNCMAFGIAAFASPSAMKYIRSILPRHISTEGRGSGALGVELVGGESCVERYALSSDMPNGEIIWGIHFPLDFQIRGAENPGAKAMVGLVKLMTEYEGSVWAMGDFNTIPGSIDETIRAATGSAFEFRIEGRDTFFGAYYDVTRREVIYGTAK